MHKFRASGDDSGQLAVIANMIRRMNYMAANIAGGQKGQELGYWARSKDMTKRAAHKARLDQIMLLKEEELKEMEKIIQCYPNAERLGKELDRVPGMAKLLS